MINLENKTIGFVPFPHILIKDIFDESFYNQLILNFPDQKYLKKYSSKKGDQKHFKYSLSSKNNSVDFKNFIMNNEVYNRLYSHFFSKEFLDLFLDYLKENHFNLGITSKDFLLEKNFITKIKDILKSLINSQSNRVSISFEFSSIPSDAGQLKPHTDSPKKILSIVIPIIEKNWDNRFNAGTNLLIPKNEKKTFNLINEPLEFEETEIKKTIDFNKNQLLILFKTYNSLHSVGPLKKCEMLFRNSLTINFERI